MQAWRRFIILVLVGATMRLVVSGVQAWRRFIILVLVGATMRLVVSGVQAWRGFCNFGTCRSNDAVGG